MDRTFATYSTLGGLLLLACALVNNLFPLSAEGSEEAATEAPKAVEEKLGERLVRAELTGVALRKKFGLSYYEIRSYCEKHPKIVCAETLLAEKAHKQLHLRFIRNVPNRLVTTAFQNALNYHDPEDQFKEEKTKVLDTMRKLDFQKNDTFRMIWDHHQGLSCHINDTKLLCIDNHHFSQTIWSIYFGDDNFLGEEVRDGLIHTLQSNTKNAETK